jgi:hypothetical protein
MEFKGVWNAATNSPTLVNGTGNAGDVWLCNVAGTVNFGAGPIVFAVGDYAVYTGSVWARSSGATGTVTSVGVSRDGNALAITGSPVTSSGTINLGFSGDNTQYINGAGNLTTFPTVINSIGLTMPAAFGVSNSPLTANGTIGVTALGYPSQYIRGDGTLADFPTSGGGGSSVSYYLNGGTSQGTIGGTTYYEMSKTADTGAGVDFNKTGDGFITAFLTDAGDPALLQIPAGNWNYEIYASMSSNGGTPEMYAELYVYNGTTFTLLSTSSHEILYDGVNLNLYTFAMAVPQTSLTVTDRLAIKLYADNSGGKTTTIHTQDSHLCQVITTFSTGLTALNGLTAQVQYFGTGTSGSDFNIVSSVATHTFNIPSASATARGLITTGTQTIAGSKTITGTTTFTGGPILSDTNLTYANSGYTLVLQSPTLSINRTVTLPNGTGTLALISDLSGYVDLTTDQTIGGTKTFSNATKNNGGILLQNGSSYSASGYMNLGGMTNGLRFTSGLGISNYFALPSATGYTYTFPSATGTVALTSDLTGGTVTSVAMSVPTGLTVSGSPITTSGTLAVTLTAGYSIPTTANQSTWTTAYNRSLTSAAVTGTTTKTLTLNQQDGGTITASWTDINTDAVTSVFGRTGAVVATEGDYTLTQLGDVTITSPSSGQVLKYNGTAWINDTDANTGTVTSVAMTVPTGLSIAGSPITSSGTLAVTFAAGYSIPTNASQTTWDTAYTNRITSLTTTGTSGAATLIANVLNIPNYTTDLSAYVTLATSQTITGVKTFSTYSKFDGGIILKNNVSASLAGYVGLSAYSASGNKGINIDFDTYSCNLFFNGTLPYSYTFPNANGTIALTSDIPDVSGYVTLITTQTISGAKTFSAALNGTSAIFTSTISAGDTITITAPASSTALALLGRSTDNFSALRFKSNNGVTTYATIYSNASDLVFENNGSPRLTIASGGSSTFSGALTVQNSSDTYGFTLAQSNSLTAGWGMWADTSGNYKLSRYGTTYGSPALTITLAGLATFSQAANFSSDITAGGLVLVNGSHFRTSGAYTGNQYYNASAATNEKAWMIQPSGDHKNFLIGTMDDSFSGMVQQAINILRSGTSVSSITFPNGTFNVTNAATFLSSITASSAIFNNGTNSTNGIKIIGSLTSSAFTTGIEFYRTSVSGGAKIEPIRDISIGGVGLKFLVTANNTAEINATYTTALTILNTGAASFLSSVDAVYLNANNSLRLRKNTATNGNNDLGIFYSNTGDIFNFYDWNTATKGMSLNTGSGAAIFTSSVTATSFFESSDSRLKTLIQDNYHTKGIGEITPKLYTKNGKVELGYYAQDFIGVLDNAISKGSDEMLSLSYREVHTAKIYALEQEIKELKAKLN